MLKIGIIGIGSMGRHHYKVLSSLPNFKVQAICDSNLACKIPGENFYLSIDEMLKCENFDGVIICTQTCFHKEIALKCIDKGLNLFIEKPVASNMKESKEILAEVNRKSVKCCIGYSERFNPAIEALKEELKGQHVYAIDIKRVGPFPSRMFDVGILTDLAVHDIDLARYITNSDIKKKKIFKLNKLKHPHEDGAFILLELNNSVAVNIITNWFTPFKKRVVEISTRDAHYKADLINQRLIRYSKSKDNSSYVLKNCFVRKEEPLIREHRSFGKYLQTGDLNNLSSIEDSIVTLECIEG